MTQSAFSDDTPTDDPAVSRNLPTNLFVILIVGAFAILLVWALRPAKRFRQGVSHPSAGRAMGDFELTPLVGEIAPVTLESLRGEVVLINFWGTWCPPCMSEFPHLVKMNDRLKSDKRFRFVPISCGPSGAEVPAEQLQAATEAYLAKLKTKLDVYRDPGGGARRSLIQSAQLGGFAFPTTVLLAPDGTITAMWQGYAPGFESEMDAAIKDLLKS